MYSGKDSIQRERLEECRFERRIREEYSREYSSIVLDNGLEQQTRRLGRLEEEATFGLNASVSLREDEASLHVQAFINNISVPTTLDELEWYIYEHGCFNVEDILRDRETCWTVPAWAKLGDIVFFMHAKTANSRLTALRTELKRKKSQYSRGRFEKMMEWIKRGLSLHKQYGGKIFAVARVIGAPSLLIDDDVDELQLHWKSRLYADMDMVCVLSNPIDISEFNSFIMVSRMSAITPVLGSEFDELKKITMAKNDIPSYFMLRDATPLPLTKINKENWMTLSNEYRRSFMLEKQFRVHYVDYLLADVGDRRTIYKECRCSKKGIADSFIDNVIFLNGKYLPVEVKLSVEAQADIKTQVRKYCQDELIHLDNKGRTITPNQVYGNRCMVIDTEQVYMYDYNLNKITVIFNLNTLSGKKDVVRLRKAIEKAIA